MAEYMQEQEELMENKKITGKVSGVHFGPSKGKSDVASPKSKHGEGGGGGGDTSSSSDEEDEIDIDEI